VAAYYYRYDCAVLELAGSGPAGGPGAIAEVAGTLASLPLVLETVAVRPVAGGLATLWLLGARRRVRVGVRIRFSAAGRTACSSGRIAAVLAGEAGQGRTGAPVGRLPAPYRTRLATANRAAGRWLDARALRELGLIGEPATSYGRSHSAQPNSWPASPRTGP